MTATLTATDIVDRFEGHGGTFVAVDGQWAMRNTKRVPCDLIAAVHTHAADIKAAIDRRSRQTAAEQLALELAAPIARPKPSSPMSFLDQQQAKFDRLCVEFGVPVVQPAAKR